VGPAFQLRTRPEGLARATAKLLESQLRGRFSHRRCEYFPSAKLGSDIDVGVYGGCDVLVLRLECTATPVSHQMADVGCPQRLDAD